MEIFHFKYRSFSVPMVSVVLLKEVVMQPRAELDPVPVFETQNLDCRFKQHLQF